MSAHTAGPWRAGIGGKFAIVVGDYPVPGIKGSDEVSYYGGHLIAESVAPQNARLIAAAPDLLRELAHLVRLLEPLERDGMDIPGLATLNGARAAIARATGAA